MFSTRAAYKGLLLFRDACQGRQDKEGMLTGLPELVV